MICPNCQANVSGQGPCPYCGTYVDPAQDAQQGYYQQQGYNQNDYYSQSNYQPRYNQPQPIRPQSQGNFVKVLVLGIVGLALSCGFWTAVPGLIISIIGLVQGNNYINTYGDVSNQARIGRRLAIAGIIVGAICSVLLIFVIIAIAETPTSILYYY